MNKTVIYRPYHHNSTMVDDILIATDMKNTLILYTFSNDSRLFGCSFHRRIGSYRESDCGSEHHLRGGDHPGSAGCCDGLRRGYDRLRRRYSGIVLEVQAGQVAVVLFWLFSCV